MILADAAISFWPSDTVSLAIIGVVSLIVKELLDRSRNAKAVEKVAEVKECLVVQAVASERREDKLDEVSVRVAENTAITEKAAEKIEAVQTSVEAAVQAKASPVTVVM